MNHTQGCYVTRDGSDVHRIKSIDSAFPDAAEFECVHPSSEGWCQVGEIERNLLARYQPVSAERLRELGID